MGLVDYGENRVLDSMLGTNHSSLFPNTVYICLFLTSPSDLGVGGIEPSGDGYARVAVVNNDTNWPAASLGSKSNGTAIEFSPAIEDWGVVISWGIWTEEENGSCIGFGELSTPLSVTTGSAPFFSPGSLTISAN